VYATGRVDLSKGQAKIQMFKHMDGLITEFNLPNYESSAAQTNWAVLCITPVDGSLKITRIQQMTAELPTNALC